jgi:hypothetical protein
MTDTPEFTRSEITRIVMAAHPELIAAMERASQEFNENEDAWQEEVARHQRNASMPRRSLESPYGKALREASTAVVAHSKELLTAGALRGPGRPTGTG